MRIQEMRSGMTHLRKKMEDAEGVFASAQDESAEVSAEPTPEPAPDCDLYEPIWAVVSFDQIEAGGMTHSQASVLLSELEASGVAGLCLVTDAAAARTRR